MASMSKQTCLFLVALCGLVAISIGLLIGLVSEKQSTKQLRAAASAQKRPRLSAPVKSGDSSVTEGFDDDDVGEEVWEADTERDDDENDDDVDDGPKFPWATNVRLPRSVIPLHYDLYLFPQLTTERFSGKVSILVNSLEPRDHFLLHTKYLEIKDTKLFKGSGSSKEEMDLMETIEYEPNEFLVFRTGHQVGAGNYTMQIEFEGSLTRGIVGFYQSVYTNGQGEKVPIATSKFQPTYARRAFPCFDEPSFKSTFSVTLIKPSNYIALSNMPVESKKMDAPSKGYTEVKFEKSVPMVTYLACFIVCDFEYKERLTKTHKTLFRVYATPTQDKRIQYALDIGAHITDYFEDYFDVKYPLPKQDMIAIPDFVSGAMEHWGLITYRETNLLYDDKESSSYNQRRVASVISHELAHQWFGNLVTLSWWDDLWLNEGFASYVEYKGVANYHPDWQMEDLFLTSDLQPVMDLDSTLNSHPIIQAVDHPDQITEIFDTITYSKGASVLRMLEDFMGPEKFRLGIKRFLVKYKYDNAVTKQLWTELEGVSDVNVSQVMDTWTRQMGFPVVTVEQVKEGVFRLRQSRFLLDPSKQGQGDPSPLGSYKWDIFVTYKTSDRPDQVENKWMRTTDDFLEIRVPSSVQWIKFNVDQKGPYRINYTGKQWKIFSDLLVENHNVLSAPDRSHLINDVFSLASAGTVDYSVALSMLSYLKKEESLAPWKTASGVIKKLTSLLIDTDSYPHLRKFVRSLVDDHYTRLGWRDAGSHAVKSNRVDLLYLACESGHPGCLQEAGNAFNAWIRNQSHYIPPNLRSIAYKYGMKAEGNEENWKIMFDRYVNEKNAQEKSKLMSGLARVGQPWILNQFLSLAKNETLVRSQDYLTCLIHIAYNPVGNPIVWNFIRQEWPYLVERFSVNDRYLGRLPKRVGSSYATNLKLEEMKAFFAKYPEAGAGKRARKQAIETIENNINWLNKNEEIVSGWLSQKAHSGA